MSSVFVRRSRTTLLCPFCGVGGWDTTTVLGLFFGLTVVGFLILFVWALWTRQFKDADRESNAPLEAEKFRDKKI